MDDLTENASRQILQAAAVLRFHEKPVKDITRLLRQIATLLENDADFEIGVHSLDGAENGGFSFGGDTMN